jgi:NAD-dependent deacetylase
MKKLVVLTGAGMSAESGIATFRGSDGLWENHRIEDVASPEGWTRNKEMVLRFYNERRKAVRNALPNQGHLILAELQDHFQVNIITQNIDDLHERAGSKNILHLHGEITKSRSTADPELVYDIQGEMINVGDTCEKGSQLRPHIVWFGEQVPMIEPAAELVAQADLFVVVGTSLQVYPAAGLIRFANHAIPKYIIDPAIPSVSGIGTLHPIAEKASSGLAKLREILLSKGN